MVLDQAIREVRNGTPPEPASAAVGLSAMEELVASRTMELAQALRTLDSRRRFIETVLDAITAGIVAVDRRGVVVLANRAALQILERSPEDLPGLTLRHLLGNVPELTAVLASAEPGAEHRLDISYTAPSGRVLDLGTTVIAMDKTGLSGRFQPLTRPALDLPSPGLEDEGPTSPRFLLLFRDLGIHRQFEAELRRVRALAALGEMATGFAHEIRNPLAAIRSLAEMLLAEIPEPDERREYPLRMLGLLKRLERLVRTSLNFGQPKDPVPRKCEAAALVEEALYVLAPRLTDVRARPRVVATPRLRTLFVDPDQMTEVLVVLLENALDSVRDPSTVSVLVHAAGAADGVPEGSFVAVEVVDDGPGIPADLQARIFDPFFTTKAKGTGLGLSIAQRLVRQNEGHLRLTSRPGETRFRILLPVEKP